MAQQEKKTGVFAKIRRSVRDMSGEMKKVVWPSRKQTLNNTVVVLVFMVVMASMVGLFDFLLGLGINTFFGGV